MLGRLGVTIAHDAQSILRSTYQGQREMQLGQIVWAVCKPIHTIPGGRKGGRERERYARLCYGGAGETLTWTKSSRLQMINKQQLVEWNTALKVKCFIISTYFYVTRDGPVRNVWWSRRYGPRIFVSLHPSYPRWFLKNTGNFCGYAINRS